MLFCHCMLETNWMNGKLFKIPIWKCIQLVKKSLHYEIFMLMRKETLLGETYIERVCILIIWENFGTKLFSFLRWENFLSWDILTRFHCTCSAQHFWHVHSLSLDFKFVYKFKNTPVTSHKVLYIQPCFPSNQTNILVSWSNRYLA